MQPINLALDAQGALYVGDLGAYRVQVYDADGKYVRTVGQYGDNYGEFARLKGVAVDRERRLYEHVRRDGTGLPGTAEGQPQRPGSDQAQ